MISLVGYTGFVGSNIAAAGAFDGLYNSKNIASAFGTNPDLLIYSGVRAEKFLANKFPRQDFDTVKEAFENIGKINPKKLVLISTIDVYKRPVLVDECSEMDLNELHPYGLNRYLLEQMVQTAGIDCLIIRLPGLFGTGIKKNFIYDMINLIPAALNEQKFAELSQKESSLQQYYSLDEYGFYKCRALADEEKTKLKAVFSEIGFTALNFTDSRAQFQFYNLAHLWADIQNAVAKNIKILNIATEPITASELYYYLFGKEFLNEITDNPPVYDFRTNHADSFGGNDGYIQSKAEILEEISTFVSKF